MKIIMWLMADIYSLGILNILVKCRNGLEIKAKSCLEYLSERKMKIAIALIFGLFCYAVTASLQAEERQYPTVVNGIDGTNGIDGIDGINGKDGKGFSDSSLSDGLSLGLAFAGMDFTSTTEKIQIGVSMGIYDGEQSGAIGLGKKVNSDTFGDVLLSIKAGQANGHNAATVSAVWNMP